MSRNRTKQLVQIVGPTDNWILERLAKKLAAKLPYSHFSTRPAEGPAALVYYVNYALYDRPSGRIDVALFTHCDQSHQFLNRARSVDFCICMSRLYADWLRAQGLPKVAHIPMGFDSYRYRPRLVLGVIGLLDHPRKGRALVDELRKLPFVEIVATEGKVPDEELPALYQRLDYVLIPATVEGGPMALLEGLGMGKPIIAPEGVGMVPEFGDTEHIRRYPAGDARSLVELVTACYEEKLGPRRLVQERTWDRWAEAHHHLFVQLLEAHGIAGPRPALGFRFSMLGEVDVPPGIDAAPLEAAMDEASRHLFWGHHADARQILQASLPCYPFIRQLLATIPKK